MKFSVQFDGFNKEEARTKAMYFVFAQYKRDTYRCKHTERKNREWKRARIREKRIPYYENELCFGQWRRTVFFVAVLRLRSG
jgi:hypothetical protein